MQALQMHALVWLVLSKHTAKLPKAREFNDNDNVHLDILLPLGFSTPC